MTDDQEERIPKVFISYSHDSAEHKKWVGELASKAFGVTPESAAESAVYMVPRVSYLIFRWGYTEDARHRITGNAFNRLFH